MINFAALCPHPALIIPSVGGSQAALAKKTVQAMEQVALDLKKHKPEIIVVISPHGPMRYDKFTVNLEESFKGSFSNFGGSDEEFFFKNDTYLARHLFSYLKEKGHPVEVIRENILDHGTLIPLFFLTQQLEEQPCIIPLTFTSLSWATHFEFGRTIGTVFNRQEENVAIIASADLSHRLTENAPAGFSPYGTKFDCALTDLLKKNDTQKILNLNPDFCDEAGECGLRSIIVALGAISDLRSTFKQLSYESPMGVGHLVGEWKI
jgi:aromatic ring-opening dioxygenase LigB subunit